MPDLSRMARAFDLLADIMDGDGMRPLGKIKCNQTQRTAIFKPDKSVCSEGVARCIRRRLTLYQVEICEADRRRW